MDLSMAPPARIMITLSANPNPTKGTPFASARRQSCARAYGGSTFGARLLLSCCDGGRRRGQRSACGEGGAAPHRCFNVGFASAARRELQHNSALLARSYSLRGPFFCPVLIRLVT